MDNFPKCGGLNSTIIGCLTFLLIVRVLLGAADGAL